MYSYTKYYGMSRMNAVGASICYDTRKIAGDGNFLRSIVSEKAADSVAIFARLVSHRVQ